MNVFVKDINVLVAVEDVRRIEVLAQDLFSWRSSVGDRCHTLRGEVKPSHMQHTGTESCWSKFAARKTTHPELVGSRKCALWCWPSRLVDGGAQRRAGVEATFLSEGSRSHALPIGFDVGSKVDAIARSGVRNITCSFAGRFRAM